MGLSTGDKRPALEALLGEDAAGLSPTDIARLTASWGKEYADFRHRDLSGREYVYVWVDGVHFNIRLEDDRLCTLVMIGTRPDGEKELLAVEDGYRESAESWKTVLRDLKRRGMAAPVLAVGDGALGFWAAAREVWPETGAQSCWCHKLSNVLDKLPKRLQPRAKRARTRGERAILEYHPPAALAPPHSHPNPHKSALFAHFIKLVVHLEKEIRADCQQVPRPISLDSRCASP